MSTRQEFAPETALTSLILALFRLNDQLQLAGDRLVAPLGLTSARGQILGAIACADRPQPVAWHARKMGVNRQGVQRIVNDLHEDGILEFRPNPHHKKAQLVVLTPKGKALFDSALALQVPWMKQLSKGLSPADVAITRKVLSHLSAHVTQPQKD